MKRETLQKKKARLFKTNKEYKSVIANLREIKETESLINSQLDTLSGYITECNKEKFAQLKKKKALETGDVVTMEVQDVESSGGDEGEEAFDDNFGNESAEDSGPDDVVEMEKTMKMIQSRINRIKKNRNK